MKLLKKLFHHHGLGLIILADIVFNTLGFLFFIGTSGYLESTFFSDKLTSCMGAAPGSARPTTWQGWE